MFKNDEPALMYTTVGEKVFPFLRTLGGDGSTYGGCPVPLELAFQFGPTGNWLNLWKQTFGSLYDVESAPQQGSLNGLCDSPLRPSELVDSRQ